MLHTSIQNGRLFFLLYNDELLRCLVYEVQQGKGRSGRFSLNQHVLPSQSYCCRFHGVEDIHFLRFHNAVSGSVFEEGGKRRSARF